MLKLIFLLLARAGMAVTHADLAPNRRSTHLGAFLMVLSILLGLFCFILSLIAEATRSQVTLRGKDECTYSGSEQLLLMYFIGILIPNLSKRLFGKLASSLFLHGFHLLLGRYCY